MKTPSHPSDIPMSRLANAFTLMETVIAIGVLAVLLTGFMAVFTPAAQGIRRSISSEQADRLTTTLEMEMATLRTGQETPNPATAFDKSFNWILGGNTPATAIFVYQYRGDPDPTKIRADGTPPPMLNITGQPGRDYIVQSISRRRNDPQLEQDLRAIEGSVFFVKPTQLVFNGGQMTLGSPGQIRNPTPLPVRVPPFPATPTIANDYSEAVIAFSAEFHSVPTKSFEYLKPASTAFTTRFNSTTIRPIFTRNLAVRR